MRKYIKKERGKKVKIDESITVDEWKQHFMNLLEGTESSRGKERRIKGGGGEEIKKEDIEKAITKLKKKKSTINMVNFNHSVTYI